MRVRVFIVRARRDAMTNRRGINFYSINPEINRKLTQATNGRPFGVFRLGRAIHPRPLVDPEPGASIDPRSTGYGLFILDWPRRWPWE